jgi:hypothetical protein
MESRILWSSSGSTPAKPTRTLALPYHPQDWFSRLQTTKYQQLIPDAFDTWYQSPWAYLRLFFLTPATVLESLALRFLVSRTAGHTEPVDGAKPVRGEADAGGNSRDAGVVVPATATEALVVGIIYDIIAPLPHIPAHVINP